MLASAVGIVALGLLLEGPPGSRLQVFRDNRLVATHALGGTAGWSVDGRLGPVIVEIRQGQARLREYRSPRLIGTRTGWIGRAGQVAACVPCGVLIRVEGGPSPADADLDAVSE